MTQKEEKLKQLRELFEMTNKSYASVQDVAKIVVEVGKVLRENNQTNDKKIENLVFLLENKLQSTLNEVKNSKEDVEKKITESSTLSTSVKSLIDQLKTELNKKINDFEYKIPRQVDLTPLQRKIEEIESKIPEIPEVVLDSPQEVRNKLESLKGNDRLDKNSIRGIEELEKDIQNTKTSYSNLASRVIGGLQGLFTYVDGAKKGILKSINFVSGNGMTITHSKVNGLDTLTFESDGAGAGTVESVTGLNTDNTDPTNPVVEISVDGVTITGAGTPGDPLVSVAGGFSGTPGSALFVGADTFFAENNDNYFFDNDAIQLRVGTVDDVYSGSSLDPLLVSNEVDDYHAITVRNRSNGTGASSDFVASNDIDDGSLNGHYINVGIASSTYDESVLVQANDGYLGMYGGNLVIQAPTPGSHIDFTTGGEGVDSLRVRMQDDRTTFLANYDADITPTFVGGNWTGTNGWSVSGGNLIKVTNASVGTIQPATPLTIGIGTTYKVTITASATSGAITYTLGGVTGTAITATTITDYIRATTTGNLVISGAVSSTATITSIVIQPLIDNTGDVLIEGGLILGSGITTTTGANVLSVDGEGVATFDSLPFGPNGVSPTQDYQLVTKLYADTLFSSGARFVDDVRAATTSALPAVTYNNGSSGVGATLTANANGALAAQDGVTLVVGNMLLVKNQASALQNGAYTVTQVGDGSNPFILTRLTTYDTSAEIVTGTFFTVLEGTTLALTQWSMNNNTTITVGTTDITFAQLSAPLTYVGGDGIDITSTTISVDLASTPGLEFDSGALRVYTDETTIERSAGGIRVKDGGITATKLVGGGVPEAPASGAIDGSNRVFVFTQTPLYINLNGMNYYEDNGYTLSGLTATFDLVLTPPTGSIIRNHYV